MRPEYIKCIAHTHMGKIGKSLCGRTIGTKGSDGELKVSEFVFMNIDHWFYTRVDDDSLLGCTACVDTIRKVMPRV